MPLNKTHSTIYKGIAILLIITCHFMGRFGHGIRVFTPLGGIGVAIFLILSGYGMNESWNKIIIGGVIH
jgi:peptidoglycan/LPS O-acetylase OafA/YrhL